MAKILADYSAEVDRLSRGELATYEEDYTTGDLTPRHPTPEDICYRLADVLSDLTSTAWNPAVQAEATQLAGRCRLLIHETCLRHGLIGNI